MTEKRLEYVKEIIIDQRGYVLINRFRGGRRAIFCKYNPEHHCGDWCQCFEVEFGRRLHLCEKVFGFKDSACEIIDLRTEDEKD